MAKMPNRSHLLMLGTLLVPGLLFAISFYYIAFHHVWPLSRDQWHMYAPYFENGLWHTLLTPMSTHRHIFPYLFFHVDMEYFHGLNHFLVICGAVFNGLIILLLLNTLRDQQGLSTFEKYCLGTFIFTLLIWLINIAQLGWGFMSTQYYLTILTLLFSVHLANLYQLSNYKNHLALSLSITCGVIATFSFGMGILVWPILFIFSWIWHTPRTPLLTYFASFTACLVLFFILPGGKEIENALLLSPVDTIKFTLQLAGGPIYYLLKSWRIIELHQIKIIASFFGISGSLIGIYLIIRQTIQRTPLSNFLTLCYALMLTGLGTAALISLTRPDFFLDVWVDRYQVWAIIFWAGLIPISFIGFRLNFLKIKNTFIIFLLVFPVMIFPSQLDLGSRLYEYKTRVEESLLSYQVELPDKEAAMNALHWNWENKLDYFFNVLGYLKENEKNIYYKNPAQYFGKSLGSLKGKYHLEPIVIAPRQMELITPNNLLHMEPFKIQSNNRGYRFYTTISENYSWKYVVCIDERGIINGVGIHVHHSILPRPTKKYSRKQYNLFAVVQGVPDKKYQWYLVKN